MKQNLKAEQKKIDMNTTEPVREEQEPIFATQVEQQKIITVDDIRLAKERLEKYKKGKHSLERRIIANEQWWKLRQWDYIKEKDDKSYNYNHSEKDPFEVATPWLWNCIISKHCDIMDGYPESNIKPRSAQDVAEAERLSKIIPIEMQKMKYEEVYSDVTLYALKNGGACLGIFFNGQKENGLGGIEVKKVDLLELFWEPGVGDIQDSRDVFYTKLKNNDELLAEYPQLQGKLGGQTVTVSRYKYDDSIDTSGKSVVVDWYYKKNINGKKVLHLCRFVNDEVLFATENEPETYPNGWYNHGKYPFRPVSLFDIEGSIFGYGYTDIGRGDQKAVDILTSAILKNAKACATPRFMTNNESGLNENEFMDFDKPVVHIEGSLDDTHYRQITTAGLSGNLLSLREELINEQKETTGNRDVSNGSSVSGVTAASGIAALQEAGGKMSRLHNKTFYSMHEDVTYFVIELIKQFYELPREYRLDRQGGYDFVEYNNSALRPQPMDSLNGEVRYRDVVFDIEVTAEKENPYKKMEQNELAIQLYNLGVFNTQNAQQAMALLQFMDFKNKDEAIAIVQNNYNIQQQIQALQQMCLTMAQQIGDPNTILQLQQVFSMTNNQGNTPVPTTDQSVNLDANNENKIMSDAREQARSATQND